MDFASVEALQRSGRGAEATQFLVEAARSVESSGADFVLLCTNPMHKAADAVHAGLAIPLLHIADATAEYVRRAGIRRVGLLGTRFTMEEDFYRGPLVRQFGLKVVVPDAPDREAVHHVIYDELCAGCLRPESKVRPRGIMDQLARQGAEGIILGGTELGLLIGDRDAPVPLFDTPRIHARAAAELALRPWSKPEALLITPGASREGVPALPQAESAGLPPKPRSSAPRRSSHFATLDRAPCCSVLRWRCGSENPSSTKAASAGHWPVHPVSRGRLAQSVRSRCRAVIPWRVVSNQIPPSVHN